MHKLAIVRIYKHIKTTCLSYHTNKCYIKTIGGVVEGGSPHCFGFPLSFQKIVLVQQYVPDGGSGHISSMCFWAV